MRDSLQKTYEGEIPESYDSALTCFDTISYTYDSGMVLQAQASVNAETSTYTYNSYGNVASEIINFVMNLDKGILK